MSLLLELSAATVLAAVLGATPCLGAVRRPLAVPDKKLVQFDWDIPTPAYFRAYVEEIERLPFDGTLMIPGCRLPSMFDPSPWGQDRKIVDIETLTQIRWKRFRHNFMICVPNNEYGMSWFDDRQWDSILDNMRMFARAAKVARCVGIGWDVEYHGRPSPWAYAEMSEGRSRTEVEAKVRERGAQVMSAWQQEFPDVKVLCTYIMGYVPPNWDLYPAFCNGLLDALGPDAQLIDGTEQSYYWADTDKWFDTHDLGADRVAPENRGKWRTQVQIGRALYPDLIWGRYVWEGFSWTGTPEEMCKRWEHNVYYGLATTDEYLWCYSDYMQFWPHSGARYNPDCDPMGVPVTEREQPYPGLMEGLESALAKYRAGQPLGWDIVGVEFANGEFAIDSSVRVQIASPTHRSSRRAPASITLEASVTTAGQIEKVVFYANVVVVGEATARPYRCELEGLPPGSYTFFARAFTRDGRHGTSGPVVVHVVGRPK